MDDCRTLGMRLWMRCAAGGGVIASSVPMTRVSVASLPFLFSCDLPLFFCDISIFPAFDKSISRLKASRRECIHLLS